MKNNYVSVGKILNFHGVRGEAKLGYSKDRETFLAKLDGVYFLIDNQYKFFEIESLRFTPKCGIIKFKGIESLNEIIDFKGCLVFVDEATAREFLEEDEFLIDELVGIEVYDGDKFVGVIVGVSNNGATDLLSVKTKDKEIHLVPFVKDLVPTVDIAHKRAQINNIEGLLS